MNAKGNTALLVLDVQNELVDPKGKVGAGGLAKIVADKNLLGNLKSLIAAFRAKGAPVVYVGLGYREDYLDVLSVAPRIAKARENKVAVRGTWGSEFHPDIAPQAGEMVFYKQCVNPFFGTSLLEWLTRNGVRELCLAGTATNLVVESAARYADDAGLAVTVVEDCCASPNPAWHDFAITQILPVFGRIVSSKDLH
ncbi:MAG: cysteine hydrolase family protein [Xanthobacteraceae bacterium]